MRLVFAFIFISSAAICQNGSYDIREPEPLKLKVNKGDSIKLVQIYAELKKYEEVIRQVQILETLKSTVIESQFNHAGIPVPQRKEFVNGELLYIKDEK